MNSPYSHMAISMLMLAAAAGVAMYRIKQIHERSESMTPEYFEREHAAYLEKMASECAIAAEVEHARAYANGFGVTQDQAAAARWNRAAAEQGDATAQLRLGHAYTYGAGVNRDYSQAASWLKKAAEKGDPEAQCSYGIYRFQGVGTEKDVIDGYTWLCRAADAGSDSAAMAIETARRMMTPEQLAAAGAK